MDKFKNITRKLRFHTKMLLTYSSIIVFIIILAGVLFYSFSSTMLQNNIRDSLTQTDETILKQMDNAIDEMDNAAKRIANDQELKDYLEMSTNEKNEDINILFNNLKIKNILLDAIQTEGEIYRGSIVTLDGDFISSKYTSYQDANIASELAWVDIMSESQDEKYIFKTHYDYWIEDKHIPVYSIIRPIKNNDEIVGFIEIQQRVNNLSQIVETADSDALVAVIKDDGEVFYSNKKLFSNVLIKHYIGLSELEDNGVTTVANPFSKLDEFVSYSRSDKNNWTVFIIQNKNLLLEPLKSIGNIIWISIFGILSISILFVYYFSKRLTVPLRQLRNKIENVDMNELKQGAFANLSGLEGHDEIEAIDDSFNEMQHRLKDAMDNELKSRTLQAKAHFDALQARIDPHFIFNMLGVVVNMSEEHEQSEIADVCRRLAKMLRYSTSASDAITKLKEEVEHAEDFLSLMKNRFEHRLEYSVNFDDGLVDALLPKFIIQPLVENSIVHGFKKISVPVMKLEVDIRRDNDQWEMVISDNGAGFDNQLIKDLNERIAKYKEKLDKYEKTEDLSIGGMGIINTFVRLSLYFGDEAHFYISNKKSGGAMIQIICPIVRTREENHV